MTANHLSRFSIAIATCLSAACVQDAFLVTADLNIEASADVADNMEYPILLEIGISPDASGETTMASIGETTPELWMVCEAPTDDWSVQVELHQNLTGDCKEIDPHVVVHALAMDPSTPCEPGWATDLDPSQGIEVATATASVFADLDGCGTYEDAATLSLLPID